MQIIKLGESVSNTQEIIESVLSKISIFKSKEKLYPEYVPNVLPHRERQLKELASIFKTILSEPGSVSQRALLVGGVGTGKTVTARAFGKDFTIIARRRGLNLKYIHVNCHRDRTLYEISVEIIKQLGASIPTRGLSPQEMFSAIHSYLDVENIYLILALDEFDYFISTAGNDAVYFLIRIYDEHPSLVKRINYIFIARTLTSLSLLDSTTESYLIKRVIRFEPYSSKELFDILKVRSEEAFYPGAVGNDVLNFIANSIGVDKGGTGNARAALELLLLSGEIAEQEGSHLITYEHVRKAYAYVDPNAVIIGDVITYLKMHELIILKAIVSVLEKSNEYEITMGKVEREYRKICSQLNLKPRRHTQVYEYIMNLKKLGIISARVSGKGYRGKTTLISISAVPLDVLNKMVEDTINRLITSGYVNNVNR